jgi:hypothetical protein
MRYFNHLLLTESFFIKGHVATGTRRLSTYLNDVDKPFLEVGHPIIISCTDGSQHQSERALLRCQDLLMAFELEESEGDETLKTLSEQGKTLTAVKIHIGGKHPMEIRGDMDSRTVERIAFGPSDFMVVKDPSIQGLPVPVTVENAVPDALTYIIVNRNRIELVLWGS